MDANTPSVTLQSDGTAQADKVVYRTKLPVRIWHWINALTIFVMLMSGATIFNAHPRLYWGAYGANYDDPWLVIGRRGQEGYLYLAGLEIPTTGFLGWTEHSIRAFPPLVTIPSYYSLAEGRQWHFFFAWVLVVSLIAFVIYSIFSKHLSRDLALKREERGLSHLWVDIKSHARLRFPTGEAARSYNALQKIAYLSVIFVLIPLVVLTGMTMSPTLNAAFPFLLDVFGGRQSARSIHFLCAAGLCAFIFIHLLMVVLAGPINELRSMITGWYRLPAPREETQP
ncbi:cytochrome b/b6 domain-containing protein [Novosphingobium sp. MMS21-SN21R]|uniref:cytochrome b/b6 domain-containing protein n=1 Tax=Novosphingobium sp. MMS21-SN21R TaxID=2969298 RepID=UPI002883AD99|nr:cytochrome b/b6 domain-containing protein [Novosphingobium sp. MMS21-SN21R]MDT0508212.1 cytochrome b/b6 domain-containing protein [Novosphingobium sp. MMS21-SN21R]